MEMNVIVTRKAEWWAWGDGGHRLVSGLGGHYVDQSLPKVPGQLNNPHPHTSNFSDRLTFSPEEFSGWVEKTTHYKQTPAQRRKGIDAGSVDITYFYLRRLKGDRITLDAQQVHEMRGARKSFLELTDREDPEVVPMVISEIAFYDKDLKFISSVNTFLTLSVGMSLEFLIDNRTPAEIQSSNEGWERYERDREMRGALM